MDLYRYSTLILPRTYHNELKCQITLWLDFHLPLHIRKAATYSLPFTSLICLLDVALGSWEEVWGVKGKQVGASTRQTDFARLRREFRYWGSAGHEELEWIRDVGQLSRTRSPTSLSSARSILPGALNDLVRFPQNPTSGQPRLDTNA